MSDKYVVIREAPIWSFITDTYTFALVFGAMLFNHRYLSGSALVDILFVIFALMMAHNLTTKRVKRFSTKEEAVKYIQEEK